jgi:hypothetical protein
MSWVAVAVAGGAVVTGYLGSQSASKATKAGEQSSAAAIAEQRRQFDLIRGDTAPYRAIGQQALNSLGSIYGYQPASSYFGTGGQPAGSTIFQGGIQTPSPVNDFLKRAASPETAIRGAFDPLGASIDSFKFFGGLFGSKKGDEKRNLKAFLGENQVYDMGDGTLAMQDGTRFPKEKLEEIAGHWYGATYAPDGNQEGWQRSFNSLIAPFRPQQQANVGQAGGGLTSDGVQQGFPGGSGTGAVTTPQPTAPDYSAFFASPDYNFRRTEGMRDIGNSFAARGGAFSGNALRALTDFNSNLAAGEFGNYFNRQAALAGIGQTATNTSAQAGLNTSGNISNALINQGNARASGIQDKYGSFNNAINGGIQNYLLWQNLRGG